MKVDPDTTVGRLLAAIPSSAIVFEKFGLQRFTTDQQITLQNMCTDGGIRLEEFLQAIENLDWNEEFRGSAAPDNEEPQN